MILSEHEAAPTDSIDDKDSVETYSPTEDERKTLRLVDKMFYKSKRWRSNYDKKWMDYYKMFRGQQWKEQRPSYRHTEVINLVFKTIQQTVPLITDSRPRWEYQAQEPSDQAFAEIMNEIAEADWVKNNWLLQLTESVYDANFYGTGFATMGYNPDAKPMQGDIFFESKDTYSMYPDPSSRDVNKRSDFIIEAEPMDLTKIRHDYPEKGQFVKADIIDAIKGEKTDLEPLFQLRLPIDETKSLRDSAGGVEGLLDKKCLKKTCYMKSDETDDTPQMDANGIQTGVSSKLKYPNGRKIVSAGGVILEDCALPFDDGLFPYARLVNYLLPREFWGMSEIEQLEHPQRIFNKLISFTLDVLTLMGNPIWIVDDEANIQTENLINSPGMIIEKNKGGEVRREPGVELQPYVLQIIDRMKDYFTDIGGTMEQSPPPGVTAASAIADIQEAAQTRIRLKARMLDAYLQDLGQMYLSRVLQYRDVPTVVRLTNDQNAAQYFKFHIQTHCDQTTNEPLQDEKGNPVRSAIMQTLGPDGGIASHKEIPIKGSLDVKVSTGSSMPFMKAQKGQQAMNLFKLQAIDQEELLKSMEWPNYQDVLQRMQQKAQQGAQMQQQQQQQQVQQQAGLQHAKGASEAQAVVQKGQIESQTELKKSQIQAEAEIQKELIRHASKVNPFPQGPIQ